MMQLFSFGRTNGPRGDSARTVADETRLAELAARWQNDRVTNPNDQKPRMSDDEG